VSARREPRRRHRPNKYPDRDTPVPLYVKTRRTAERLTQRSLAELAGVAPRVIWELEHGKRTMRMDVVNAVLGVFGKALGVVDAPRPASEDE
jgi:transcriptional regulator with XRE-family HTH domain